MAEAPLYLQALAWAVRRLPAGRYRAVNRFGRVRRAPFTARLPRDAGGYRFACDLRDTIAREVFFTGAYGPQESALLRAILSPGATFVDAGANWGFFTLLAAHRVGAGGRVVALEPDPRLFRLLRENVSANSLGRVWPLEVAVADREGSFTLAGHDPDGGNWGLSSIVAEAGPAHFRVRGVRLDDVLDERGIDRVDLLKMDVEGAEEMALRGMADGLMEGRWRRVLLELHPSLAGRGDTLLRDVAATFVAAGYRGWTVDSSPRATRRTAYARRPDARALLLPLATASADAWPHQLWAAPGQEPL